MPRAYAVNYLNGLRAGAGKRGKTDVSVFLNAANYVEISVASLSRRDQIGRYVQENISGPVRVEWVRLVPSGLGIANRAASRDPRCGSLKSEPIMWITMATSLTAMAAVAIMAIVILMLERNSPLNKLQWIPIFQVDLTPVKIAPPGNRAQRRAQKFDDNVLTTSNLDIHVSRTIDRGQLGAELTNISQYPISCILDSATSSLEDFQPPRAIFPKAPFIVAPGGGKLRVCDDPFDMHQTPCGRLLGTMNLKLRYGHPEKEQYEMIIEGVADTTVEHYGLVSTVRLSQSQKVTG